MQLVRLAALFCTLFTFSVSAQPSKGQGTERFAPIRSELEKKVGDGTLPSVSVGILKDGRVVWLRSFGYADVEKKIAATPHTIYALGSLSKSITGTAVFKLVQDGKVDLEQPITKYLTTAPIDFHGRDPNPYKVFHLLNMAAGIPHYWRYCYSDAGDLKGCGRELFGQASFSAFAAGTTHIYSNQSFGLAERMVADVTRMSFARYLRSSITGPAGMSRTFTHLTEIPKKGVVIAEPYKRDGNRAADLQFEPAGGGGYFSTVNDLLKYGAMHIPTSRNAAVLSSKTLAENHRVRNELPHAYYANGWGVLPLPNNSRTLLSNGAIEGAASTLLVLPDAQAVIVVLVNKSVGNEVTDDIAFRLADVIVPGYKAELDKLFAKLEPLFSDAAFQGDTELDGDWQGFATIRGRTVDVRFNIEGPRIRFSIDGADAVELSPVRIASNTVRGRLPGEHTLKIAPSGANLSVSFRRTGDKLEGHLAVEILRPKPDHLLSYYLSVTKVR